MRDARRESWAGCVLLAAVLAVGGCELAAVDSRLATVSEVRYEPDANGDCWQTPAETARRGRGDCEDLAFYLHELLRRDAVASRVVFGVEDMTEARTGHAWVECVAHGQTYVVDPARRLLTRRSALPWWRYCALTGRSLGDSPLLPRLREYLGRSGQTGLNENYEAALFAGCAHPPAGD